MDASLDAVIITRPVCQAVKGLIETDRDRIDQFLSQFGYKNERGGALKLASVLYGVRPENRAIQVFPTISVVPVTRNPQWFAYRMTNDTLPVRIFCCVENKPDNQEVAEELMNDLTEITAAILFANPVFPFTCYELASGEIVAGTASPVQSVPANITFGTLDAGHIKAGQIDFNVEILLGHENMNL